MKVALCCIIKKENIYLPEFVEYYINLGIDKIYIYDNNDIDGENPIDVIKDEYKKYIEIIYWKEVSNYPHPMQQKAYHDCYHNFGSNYDWMCFFDIDEYLTLNGYENIKDYLSDKMFNDFDLIHINWMLYDDNDLLYYEPIPFIKRFTRPCDFNIKINYDFPENNIIKSIVKCNKEINWIDCGNPHTPINNLKTCNNKGEECESENMFLKYNYEKAYIKHFIDKTIEEYTWKRKRGDVQGDEWLGNMTLDTFFKLNKRTEEKENIWKKIFDK